jgi:hypothetical protein
MICQMYMYKVQIRNWTSFERFVVFIFSICVLWINYKFIERKTFKVVPMKVLVILKSQEEILFFSTTQIH